MNSKDYKNLSEAYESVYLKEQTIEFCNEFIFETEEESQYFVNILFEDEELAVEFFDDIAEYIQDNQLHEDTYIAEVRSALIKRGLQAAGGLLKQTPKALRGMSAKTLTKQGFQSGGLTKAGKQLALTNKPALATQTKSIQQARSLAKSGIPSERPGKYLDMLQQKRALKALPPAGGTGANTFKATAERGFARDKSAREGLGNVLDTFTQGLKGFIKRGSAQDKLARAAKGTKGTEIKIGQPGITPTKVSAPQGPKPYQAPVPEFPVSKSTTMGKVQAPQPPKAPKPAWEEPRSITMPKAQTSPQQPVAPAPQWGGSQQAQDIKRFNQLNKGGVIGGSKVHRAPQPAWGSGGGNVPKDLAVDKAFAKPKGGALAKIDNQSSRVIAAKNKLDTAAKGTANIGPATPMGAGGGALVRSSGTSSISTRSTAAKNKLDTAAKGTANIGPATPMGAGGGGLVSTKKPTTKDSGTTNGAVPGALTRISSSSSTSTVSKGRKIAKDLLTGLGIAGAATALGIASRDRGDRGIDAKSAPEPKNLTPKTTPAPSGPKTTPAPSGSKTTPAPSGSKTTSVSTQNGKDKDVKKPQSPAPTTGPRPMTKVDTDVMDLMNMRARSLDRQGRTKDAEELRANIEKKYGGRKPYEG